MRSFQVGYIGTGTQGNRDEPYIYEVTRRIHMCSSVGRQVSQARAIEEVAIVNGIHKVSKVPQSRFRVHRYCYTGEAHTDVDDPLKGGKQLLYIFERTMPGRSSHSSHSAHLRGYRSGVNLLRNRGILQRTRVWLNGRRYQ